MLKIKELLAKMLGQCEFKTLLWTNPNPDSSFSAKTIQGVTSETYDSVMCVYNGSTSLKRKYTALAPVGWYGELSRIANVDAPLTTLFLQRQFCLTNSGDIAFSDCRTKQGSTNLVDNSYVIPLEIYGIKFAGGGYYLKRLLTSLVTLLKGGVANVKRKEDSCKNTYKSKESYHSVHTYNSVKELRSKFSHLVYRCARSSIDSSTRLHSNRCVRSICIFFRAINNKSYYYKSAIKPHTRICVEQIYFRNNANDSSKYSLYQNRPFVIAKGVA